MERAEIGLRIKTLREQKRLSQNALANLAGVSPTYIYQLERGEKSPTVEYLSHICWGLGVTLQEFFSEDIVANDDKIESLTQTQRKLLNDFLSSIV